MGKSVHDDVLDAALAVIATSNIMTVCSQEPTTRTEAVTTYALADTAMTTGTATGADYTLANATGGGRKVTVAQQTGVTIDATATGCSEVALCDAADLNYVTTCTTQALATGNTMTFGSWSVTIGDPS